MTHTRKKGLLSTLGLIALMILTSCSAPTSPEVGVLMAFDFGHSATRAQEKYVQSFGSVLGSINVHADVGVMPITNKSGGNPIIWEELPSLSYLYALRSGKGKRELRDQAASSRDVLNVAVETMRQAGVATAKNAQDPDQLGTNILAVLLQAQDSLKSYGSGKRFLVVYSDMVNQAPELEMTKIRPLDPAETVKNLKAKGLVAQLTGVNVYLIGPGSTGDVRFSTEEIQKIREFWYAYFAEAGAKVLHYGEPPSKYCISTPEKC